MARSPSAPRSGEPRRFDRLRRGLVAALVGLAAIVAIATVVALVVRDRPNPIAVNRAGGPPYPLGGGAGDVVVVIDGGAGYRATAEVVAPLGDEALRRGVPAGGYLDRTRARDVLGWVKPDRAGLPIEVVVAVEVEVDGQPGTAWTTFSESRLPPPPAGTADRARAWRVFEAGVAHLDRAFDPAARAVRPVPVFFENPPDPVADDARRQDAFEAELRHAVR